MQTPIATTYQEVTTWLIDQIASHTGLPRTDISPEQPLANYGFDSVQSVSLSTDIEDEFGLPMPSTLVWDYPTIEKLAEYLVAELSLVSPSAVMKQESELIS
jgi:acyl carrier protein